MNMKKLLSILSIACLTLFPSCNDWLDVTPQGQVEAEELYETTQGCNSVVTGIYHTLSSSSLFGQNLSYGLIDIMAQYWDFSTNTSHIYYPATQFNYDDTNVDGQITTMWQQLYYAITQCNAFIYYSDPYKENIKHYDLLLGEVYGLRALAHMTLFELYGPVIHSTADLQKSAIAYRTEYNNVSKNFDTGEVVLQKAAEDLNRAIELFAAFGSGGGNIAHFAHLGGMLFGWLLILYWRHHQGPRGGGFTGWENYQPPRRKKSHFEDFRLRMKGFFSRLRTSQPTRKFKDRTADYDYNARKKAREERIDHILDKVKRSGYDSLTAQEKKDLFDYSNK